MSSKSSKRERFRGFLKDTGHSLSDLFRASSPTPSSSGAYPTQDVASATLKVSIKALSKSASAIPALKSFVDILTDCVGNTPTAAKNHKDYEDLASSIAATANGLKEHLNGANNQQMVKAVGKVIEELNLQAGYIVEKQGRTKARTYIEADADIDDLIGCYRRIESLLRQLHIAKEATLERLNPSKTARYDSIAVSQVGRGGCTPKTRELVLQGLLDWANDPHGAKVYWMNGMAGTGKTTIAYSFCGKLEQSRQLGASFFCSRSLPDCRDGGRIVPTLAYQLACTFGPYRDAVCRILGEYPDVGVSNANTQFEKLLRVPLAQLKSALPSGLLVVVIDALDECSDPIATSLVLDVLLRFVEDLPLKLFVTCRPEYNMLSQVRSLGDTSRSLCHLHDIERSLVQADIETYLQAQLSPFDVSANSIALLAERSRSLFIYAATTARYIQARNTAADHHERLEVILGTSPHLGTRAFEPLDVLYSTILSSVLVNSELESWEKANVNLILHTVVCAMEPLPVDGLAHILELRSTEQARRVIEPLRSVLNLDESTGLVSTLHASFPDYLFDASRSGDFSCDRAVHNQRLARTCFETMNNLLKFNICDLQSSFVLDQDVPNLAIRVDRAVPPHLFYACRYWSGHLMQAGDANGFIGYLEELLCRRLLFWLEVMNLKQETRAGALMLSKIYRWMKDGQKFITVLGANPVGQSTAHIYVSVLALWDKSDPMWLHYGSRMHSPVQAKGTAIDNRESAVLAVWQARDSVFSVSVSPDGNRVASAHHDGTICVWDTHTGDIVTGPLEGHTGPVNSVAFLPDSTYYASGSDDKSVRIWDAKTGQLVTNPCEGHTGIVRSVVYSPNGRYIASGAGDCTIRIWDATTGQPVGKPYIGHTADIWSIAYSLDGRRLASGAGDCTIRVWDAQTGNQLIDSLIGHTRAVRSVTFSIDGSRIASGSEDHTVRIWDSQSGQLVAGPFEGHADTVYCVAYSPDGNHIASASQDHTIRIWDAQTGQTVAGPLRGHTYHVYAAVFMPDGDRIVSCSPDRTIRIWDARTRHTRSSLSEGHTASVCSVAFSPDSSQIVSGSDDCTVCIWDAQTGSGMAGPFKGHTTDVNSVAFSPSSDSVASASNDRTIRVWDARTGAMHGGPFEGHTAEVSLIAFSPDGSRIASGSEDDTIRVWDSQTGKMAAGPFRGHTDSVDSVAYSPDGDRIVSGSGDRTVRIWDARTGMALAPSLEGHTDDVFSVAYSPDGKHIVSGSWDRTIRIWDVQSGATLLGTLIGHTGRVFSVAYSPHGRHIVSGSEDHTIRIWDAETRQPLAGPFRAHTHWVFSVTLSPDGRFIASGSHDYAIRVWDLQKCLSTGPANRDYWTMNEDGWVVGHDSSLLFWVPPDLRPCLKWPQNVAVIHQLGSFELDFTNALVGPRWTECY
ncbi:hypothetical protein FRC07_001695, partial [Ceratobasidium sp. 392]